MYACPESKGKVSRQNNIITLGHAVDHRQKDDSTSVQAMVEFYSFLLALTVLLRKLFLLLEKLHTSKSHSTQKVGVDHPSEAVTTLKPLIKCLLLGSSVSLFFRSMTACFLNFRSSVVRSGQMKTELNLSEPFSFFADLKI